MLVLSSLSKNDIKLNIDLKGLKRLTKKLERQRKSFEMLNKCTNKENCKI